jgi:ferredoxin
LPSHQWLAQQDDEQGWYWLNMEALNAKGEKVKVKQPHIDPELCIGCGICEKKCPVADRGAVFITSVGEIRNPKNQILLPESPDGGAAS